MILAAAQTIPFRHNTEANIQSHVRLIESAAEKQVDLIVFPEMSLTGYELESADEMAFSENDPRLEIFKEKAALHRMIIMAGAPIKTNAQLHLGAFVFLPDRTVLMYTKQFLHTGEDRFFSPSFAYNPLIEWENERISFAICADITNPLHPANAGKNKTTLYVASIFYTPKGLPEAYQQLSDYAKQYNMNILMANYGGPSYNMESAGQSAFWNSKGELAGKLGNHTEGLLVVRT